MRNKKDSDQLYHYNWSLYYAGMFFGSNKLLTKISFVKTDKACTMTSFVFSHFMYCESLRLRLVILKTVTGVENSGFLVLFILAHCVILSR